MNKILRMVSIVMIAIGLSFLAVSLRAESGSKLSILEQPSYYVAQSYIFIFAAGIVAVVFNLLGSFFAWFKKMDTIEEVLPNAGYATSKDIMTWLGDTETGSGLRKEKPGSDVKAEVTETYADDSTELMDDRTELDETSRYDTTVLMDDRTEVMDERELR